MEREGDIVRTGRKTEKVSVWSHREWEIQRKERIGRGDIACMLERERERKKEGEQDRQKGVERNIIEKRQQNDTEKR